LLDAPSEPPLDRLDVYVLRQRGISVEPLSVTPKEISMSIGVSIFLIAVGAILAFAVEKVFEGIDLIAVGWILMAVGGLGLILSLLFWSSFSPYGSRRRVDVVDDRGPVV
jgi:hypothetical protein